MGGSCSSGYNVALQQSMISNWFPSYRVTRAAVGEGRSGRIMIDSVTPVGECSSRIPAEQSASQEQGKICLTSSCCWTAPTPS